ncbi:hypothetical protein MATR_28020 [Marivirga tractuosa]|nr:hypothetical protein MATR_28020 [Marivirga tractuosa]
MDSTEWLLFISTFIRRKNLITIIYWTYLFIGLVGGVFILFDYNLVTVESRFWIIGITGGLLISLLVSPVLHELIQVIFFKLYGAKHVKFKWNWSLFRFNVQANDFTLSKWRYYGICLVTFSLFSILPFLLAFYADGAILFTLLSLSFFHALYAMKDLAVCSYLYKFPNCYIYSSEQDKTVFYKTLPK